MDVTIHKGYSGCKGIFRESIETSVLGIARNFVFRASGDRATNGNRYILTRTENQYAWLDKTNNARVGLRINIERDKDNGKYWVSLDFEESAGIPCMFLVSCIFDQEWNMLESDIFHKGGNPSNAVIQGIYGRLVDHTDALDYKDLDYV